MKKIKYSADKLVESLLGLSDEFQVSILDSCGVNYLDSRFLIAGISPIETHYLSNENPQNTLDFLDEKLSDKKYFNIFTIAYDFGLKLEKIKSRRKEFQSFTEPDSYLAVYDTLILHDYRSNETFLIGNEKKFDDILSKLKESSPIGENLTNEQSSISSNFSKKKYLQTINEIQERIRRGDTYQTNLTQQFSAILPNSLTAEKIFWRLRKDNPAPFAAFIKRKNDSVVSTSPERFFRIENDKIQTSPIKGTRPRGGDKTEDDELRIELLTSAKDLAENTMIVDLLRNDLGRVCKFGSVTVDKLYDLEIHPTFFHLVSTISGELKKDIKISEILKAVFPCGSITGAPKIKTMQIIDQLETTNRGLSMGAIGFGARQPVFYSSDSQSSPLGCLDLSVTIRTMVIKDKQAIFNVGGGILIDSIPENEYEETLVKAKAIFNAINANLKNLQI